MLDVLDDGCVIIVTFVVSAAADLMTDDSFDKSAKGGPLRFCKRLFARMVRGVSFITVSPFFTITDRKFV